MIPSTGQRWGDFSCEYSRQCPCGDFVLLVSARANRRDERGFGEGLVMASVEFRSVAKRFSADAAALTDLSLTIGSGEFLVLLGPSGCGKSTALRLLAGLEDPTSGELFIDGLRVNDVPAGGRELGMVFQSYALYPHLSVRDNLTFGLRNGPRSHRLDNAEIDRRVDEAIALLDLGELVDRLPRELSGGQQQRVAIGRALARTKVLPADEPLSNLDAKLRNRMRFEHGDCTSYTAPQRCM